MGKVIMVSEEVYNRLSRLKRPGESFSDVIKRLLNQKPRLTEIAGRKTITRRQWKKIKKMIREVDDLDEIRMKYILSLFNEK